MNESTEKTESQDTQSPDRWKWTEPSEDEFEKRRLTENFYRIFFIDEKTKEDIILYKFWAKNDDEAFNVLNDYKKYNPEPSGVKYFYSSSGYYVNPDGVRFDTLKAMIKTKETFLMKVVDFFKYKIFHAFGKIVDRIRDLVYFMENDHAIGEWWSLDTHMLDDLRYNLPLLIKHHIGCPTFMCEKARQQIESEENSPNYNSDEMNLAMKMWEDELNGLLEHVLLYTYYSNYGIIGEKEKDLQEIDKKYKDTIPYKPGTNNAIDYQKLSELERKHWNAIWDWIKENGEALWD